MIKKLTPVKLSESGKQNVNKQFASQSTERTVPKSLDPKNFPVWEVPVNQKVLCYVPNHTVMNENGVEELRMDKPLIHSVRDGNRFLSYRCINGIVSEEDGFDGSCPLCDGTSEPWDLAREIIAQKCSQQGLDPEDVNNPDVKRIRSEQFSNRVVKEAVRYFAFPIVVIDTVNNDGKTPAKDENGKMVYRIYWYTISENGYKEKWEKILESLDDEPTHPGGHFFILNYCYTPKKGEPNKRDSARNLVVSGKTFKNMGTVKTKLDELTAEWTPEKARETIVNNVLYAKKDLEYVADAALENTRNMLALYKGQEMSAGFQLEKKDTPIAAIADTSAADAPKAMDETDLDEGDDGDIDIV